MVESVRKNQQRRAACTNRERSTENTWFFVREQAAGKQMGKYTFACREHLNEKEVRVGVLVVAHAPVVCVFC